MKLNRPCHSVTDRRDFLRSISAFAAVLSWHPGGHLSAQERTAPPKKKAAGKGRFSLLRLQATHLAEMQRFYAKTLGVPVHAKAEQSFTAAFGETMIEFQQVAGKQEPCYHFAFNVPENKFKQAKGWLADRCPLLKDSRTGADELFFEEWNAHAVYFRDPSGNIGELIARHTLANARDGAFKVQDLLYASEIGLVSPEPARLVAGIGDAFGLKPFLGNSFFIGDEYGLFVLPPEGRPWIPERRQKAAVFAAEVTVTGCGAKAFCAPKLPYRIRGEAEPGAEPDPARR